MMKGQDGLFSKASVLRLPCSGGSPDTAFCLGKGCLYSLQQAGTAAKSAAPVVGDVFGFVEELAVIVGTGFHLMYLLLCCFDGLIIH